jgi:hypothetical protein
MMRSAARRGLTVSLDPKPALLLTSKHGTANADVLQVGMTMLWDAWGVRHAVTVLHLDDNQVTQVLRDDTHGYTALQASVA